MGNITTPSVYVILSRIRYSILQQAIEQQEVPSLQLLKVVGMYYCKQLLHLFMETTRNRKGSHFVRLGKSVIVHNSHNVHLNTFGTDKYTNIKYSKVNLFVEVTGSADVEISSFTQTVICSPLQSRVDIRNYPHLRGIKLANRNIDYCIKIDTLIGADKYYEFVDGEARNSSGSSITNTSSKLGWLLSGPVACTSVIKNNR